MSHERADTRDLSRKPRRILFSVPSMSAPGGVAGYYSRLNSNIHRFRVNSIVQFLEVPVSVSGGSLYRVYQAFEWVMALCTILRYAIWSRPDVLILNPSLTPFCILRDSLVKLFFEKLCGAKTIVFFRGWNETNERYFSHPVFRVFSKILLRAETVLCLTARSERMLRRLCEHGVRVLRFHTMVDPELVEYTKSVSPENFSSERQILFLGNIAREKGVFDLLDAFSHVQASMSGYRLLYCGDGKDRDELKQLVADKGLGSVVDVFGPVYGVEKYAMLCSSKIFVLPSYSEGMPNAVLEALASKSIVICTPVGALQDFIDEGLASSVAVGSASELSARLLQHAESSVSTFCEANSALVRQKFSVRASVDFLEEQIDTVLGS